MILKRYLKTIQNEENSFQVPRYCKTKECAKYMTRECLLPVFQDVFVGTKGVSHNHRLSFDDNKVLKLSIGYAKHLFKCVGP